MARGIVSTVRFSNMVERIISTDTNDYSKNKEYKFDWAGNKSIFSKIDKKHVLVGSLAVLVTFLSLRECSRQRELVEDASNRNSLLEDNVELYFKNKELAPADGSMTYTRLNYDSLKYNFD